MQNIASYINDITNSANLTAQDIVLFLSVATATMLVVGLMQARQDIRRRAGTLLAEKGEDKKQDKKSHASTKNTMLDYADKYFRQADGDNLKILRRKMIQAGFLDPRAIAAFFAIRITSLIFMALLAWFIVIPWALPKAATTNFWALVGSAGLLGYYIPVILLDKRITAKQTEHRQGFPDFMDLMVVCADAGLAMESAIDRVGHELTLSYPSLAMNMHMATLEMRAGRTMSEALEHLSERLGIEEAKSFATLLQQSEELGSSMTEALRVYSDEMRHKRLTRAEEKAYALPAKMVIPMGLCVFPVVLIVTMLPAAIRMMERM